MTGGEDVAEALDHLLMGHTIHEAGYGSALAIGVRAQIVDAVHMIGMGMGQEDCIQACDGVIQELEAQVRRAIDQDRSLPFLASLHHDRDTAAPIARLARVASPPIAAGRAVGQWHAARTAAAEDRDFHAASRGPARWKSRKKFSVVVAAISSRLTPFTSARTSAVWRTKAGSLRLPRCGAGAR